MKKLVACKALETPRVWVRFDDGAEGVVDLSHLAGKGVFRAWDDPDFFQQVRVDDWGALVWSDAIDLCPDALYLQLKGMRPEDLFPTVAQGVGRA